MLQASVEQLPRVLPGTQLVLREVRTILHPCFPGNSTTAVIFSISFFLFCILFFFKDSFIILFDRKIL